MVRHRDVLTQQRLDFIERIVLILQRGDQAQGAEAAGRNTLGTEGLRMLQEVALKAVEAERNAVLELLDSLDLLGNEFQVAALEALYQVGELFCFELVDLDLDVGELEES